MHFYERFSERRNFSFVFQHLYKLQIGFDSHHPLHSPIPQPPGCGIFLCRIRTLPLRCAAGRGGRFPAPTKKFSLSARASPSPPEYLYILLSFLFYSSLLYSALFCSILLCSVLCTDRRLTSPRRRHDIGFCPPGAEPPQENPAAVLFIRLQQSNSRLAAHLFGVFVPD